SGPDMTVELAEAAALLRSGASPEAAWRAVGCEGIDPDGAPRGLGDGLVAVAARAAARLAHRTGAPLAPVLDDVRVFAVAAAEANAAREAALAGPRMSARVLTWLPGAGVALGAIVDTGVL